MTEHVPLAGKSILVVEDDYLLARDTCEWLQEAGATVVGPAPTAEQACGLLESQPVDLAVVDINLGFGPTYDVAGRLSDRGVPFVFATGYDHAAIPDGYRDRPRIEKPFSGKRLISAVGELAEYRPKLKQ